MKIKYHEAKSSDLPSIVEVIYEGQKDWPRRESLKEIEARVARHQERKTFLLARDRGKTIATAFYFPEKLSLEPRGETGDGDAHLGGFYLLPKYWGSGEAGRFLDFVLRRMSQDGFRHVRLWSPSCSQRASMFYQKEGWRQSGRSIDWQGLERVEYLRPLSV